MKYKLAEHKCIDRICSYTETDHKNPDARKCPRCGKPTNMKYVKKHGDR